MCRGVGAAGGGSQAHVVGTRRLGADRARLVTLAALVRHARVPTTQRVARAQKVKM